MRGVAGRPGRSYHRRVGSRGPIVAIAAAASLAVPAGGAAAASACLKPAPAVSALIARGLRPSLHVEVARVAAVRGRGHFTSVLSSGVYFVSADLGKQGVATWAFSTGAYKTGHGAAFSVDRNARRVSVLGSLVSPQLLAGWGVGTRTKGYSASRACAG